MRRPRRDVEGYAVYVYGRKRRKPKAKKLVWPPTGATTFVRGYPVRKAKPKKQPKEKLQPKKFLPRHTAFKTTINGIEIICSFTRTGNLITVGLNSREREGVYARFHTTEEALISGETPAIATLGKNFAANCGNPLEAFQQAASRLKQKFDLGKK